MLVNLSKKFKARFGDRSTARIETTYTFTIVLLLCNVNVGKIWSQPFDAFKNDRE